MQHPGNLILPVILILMENRLGEAASTNQSPMQISSDCADDNPRASHIDVSGSLHPILNYSIQTGEEFSLEFMRERANARKNQNVSSGMDIKGVAGLQSCDSENGPKLWQKDSSAVINKGQNEPLASAQRVSFVDGINRGISSGHACSTSYNNLSAKMRFLCSYGGKILPRPSDGKLRYVGGNTHIIQIRKDISFQELKQKTLSISNIPHIIKYQLPGEDLDSLISVSCDEDLQNMIEEFNILEDDRSQKLRMFLFFDGDRDEMQFSLGSKEGDSDMYFVAAVNCMELGSTEDSTSHLVKNTFSSDLDQLLNFGNEDINATNNRVEMQSDRLNSVPLEEVLILPSANSDIFPMHPDIQNNTSTFHSHQVYLKHALDDHGLLPQKDLGPEEGSLTLDVLNEGPDNPFHERDNTYPVNQLQETDKSYPHRPYESADLSRGTSTLLSSSIYRSKSHNCINSQRQMSSPPPNLTPQDTLHQVEQSISLSKQAYSSPLVIADAVKKTENSSEIIEPTHTNFRDSISDPSGNRTSEFSQMDNNEFLTSQSIHNTRSTEAAYMGSNLSDTKNALTQGQPEKAPLCDSEMDVLNSSTVASVSEEKIGSTSNLPGINWECTSQITYPNNAMENDCLAFDSEPLLGDILADINNRFPPPLVSGIFKTKNHDSSSPSPSTIYNDKLKMTVNLQNPEQKNWSFFQNLAQDQFRKDFSLIDQDHINYNYPPTVTTAAISKPYDSTKKSEDVEIGHESQIYFGDEMHQERFGIVDNDTTCHHHGFSSSGARMGMDGEGMQVVNPFLNAGENLRAPISDYEEVKLDVGDANYPFIGFTADFDLNNLQSIKNDDLEELKELGSGSFGTVYHGKWRGSDVAIKRIKKSCLTGRSSEQERLTLEFWKEAEILSSLHHPNVVAFYGVVRDGPEGTLATVTEYMVNGSLRNVLIRKDSYLDHRKQLIIAMDTAFGMEYLHSKNIVHFDLKCDNLLVNLTDPHRPICKVGDFGLSKIKRNTLVSGGVRGTLPWMAPELLSSSKVSEKVDVFSFGIVMWEILTGEEPYANMHYGAIIGGIVSNTLRPPVPKSCDPDWRMLMEQCWDVDPVQRPSFTEIASRLRLMSAAQHRKTPAHK